MIRAVADAILHRKRGALFVQRRLPILLPLNAQYLLYLRLLGYVLRSDNRTRYELIIYEKPAVEQRNLFLRQARPKSRVKHDACHVRIVVQRVKMDAVRAFL